MSSSSSNSSDLASIEEAIRNIRLVVFDFDGVFTDNCVYVSDQGSELVRCYRGDGLGLEKLRRLGIDAIILSTEANSVVSVRARKLKIQCIQGCDDKRSELGRIAGKMNLTLDEIAFVGNDVNDAACLEAVGLPIVVNDAHQEVLPLAAYRTQRLGGNGAVREVCDLFEQVLGPLSATHPVGRLST